MCEKNEYALQEHANQVCAAAEAIVKALGTFCSHQIDGEKSTYSYADFEKICEETGITWNQRSDSWNKNVNG